LYAARAGRHLQAKITVVDRRNHHLFQPLLYQVATAALNPSDIAAPIRSILSSQKNATVLLGEALSVDAAGNRLVLDCGAVPFDYLILATGATHSYFGHDEWAKNAPGLKTIEDALDIRRRVLLAFEEAEREPDPIKQRAWLTFAIVGGGPTGVELAGALAEISRKALARDFRRIDPGSARIILIEGLPRVLQTYAPSLSERAAEQLRNLGVEVLTGTMVTAIDAEGVTTPGERIEARTVVWAAGVRASALVKSLDVELDRAGRVKVSDDLTAPGHPNIFVIGDVAAVPFRGGIVPGVAPAAIQEGEHAMHNIARLMRGLGSEPFRYRDKGSLATIGRAAGIAEIGRVKISGFFAWLAWLMIHIFFLIGFRNRFLVLFEWAWAYFTYERGARLITGGLPPIGESVDQEKKEARR
jgi:NADH dehydrogenase